MRAPPPRFNAESALRLQLGRFVHLPEFPVIISRMHLVVFEASRWASMAPLSLNRPVFTLLIGTSSLLEKQIQHVKPLRVTLWVRPQMVEFCKKHVVPSLSVPVSINTPLDDEPALLTSGRTLHFSQFPRPTDPMVSVDDGKLI